MARRGQNGKGGKEPGFLGSIRDKFQAILGKIQGLSDLAKPIQQAPPKKQEPASDNSQAFVDALRRVVGQGYFKHLQGYVGKPGAPKQEPSPGQPPSLPTPKQQASLIAKLPKNNPTPAKQQEQTSAARQPADKPLPNWLQYQVSLQQHRPPPSRPTPRGPVPPRGYRRGARLGGGLVNAGISLARALHPTAGGTGVLPNLGAASKALGGGLGAMGGAAGAVGGALSAAAAPVALIGGLVTATEKLRQWTNHLHESNMQFAQFSASMTRVEVESQMRNIMLSRERGERRAASAQYLAEQRDALNKSIAPIEDAFAMFKNRVFGDFAGGLSVLINGITKMADKINGAMGADKLGGTGHQRDYVAEFMKDLAVEKWHEKYGRPSRFNSSSGDFGGRDF